MTGACGQNTPPPRKRSTALAVDHTPELGLCAPSAGSSFRRDGGYAMACISPIIF
nr:MAG TPA: hypothetical protein [Caudoviricetes sp.]